MSGRPGSIAQLVFCGAIALGLAIWAQVTAGRGRATKRWSATRAVVIKSWIERHTSSGHRRSRSRKTSYQLKVRYRYRVGSTHYTSERYQFGGKLSSRERAAMVRRRARYMPQATVRAYYDPADPSRAVLVRGVGGTIYVLFAAASFCLALGVVMRRLRPKRPRRPFDGGRFAVSVLLFLAVFVPGILLQLGLMHLLS